MVVVSRITSPGAAAATAAFHWVRFDTGRSTPPAASFGSTVGKPPGGATASGSEGRLTSAYTMAINTMTSTSPATPIRRQRAAGP
jgi:hypothetical protein